MRRRRWAGLIGVLLVVGGCGTETAAGSIPERTPTPTPTRRATPTPTPPPPTCPASGVSLTVGDVDAALGHRAVVITLTNCRSKVMTVNGYPDVTILDGKRRTMDVTVTHGTSYMAIDPEPTAIRLRKGETATAAVSWSNTVEIGADKSAGTYLSIASRAHDKPVIWPVVTDIGTTARLTLTAWCLKFPT
ncbi:DUF4232 domain-containing protein [Kribbella sp. NPDC055071]